MVWFLRGLLGVAPHPHPNGYRLSANRGRLGRDAPFSKTVLMATRLVRGTTFPIDGDSADHRNHQDQNSAEKLGTLDRQPCHGSAA
jgi:hypothetical protein